MKGSDRNKPCPCGSGWKAKKCGVLAACLAFVPPPPPPYVPPTPEEVAASRRRVAQLFGIVAACRAPGGSR